MVAPSVAAEQPVYRAIAELIAALERLAAAVAEPARAPGGLDLEGLVAVLEMADSVGPEIDWVLSSKLDRLTREVGLALERRGISADRARAEYTARARHREASRREQAAQWRQMLQERRERLAAVGRAPVGSRAGWRR
jgi:hypothetical protein